MSDLETILKMIERNEAAPWAINGSLAAIPRFKMPDEFEQMERDINHLQKVIEILCGRLGISYDLDIRVQANNYRSPAETNSNDDQYESIITIKCDNSGEIKVIETNSDKINVMLKTGRLQKAFQKPLYEVLQSKETDLDTWKQLRTEKAEADALEELEKEWGKSGSQNFNQHLHYITLAISKGNLKEVLHKSEVIDAKNGVIKDAKVAIALAKMGEEIFHKGNNQ